MKGMTLEQIHEDIVSLKRDMEHIKILMEEKFELDEELLEQIEESRKRPKKDFISHEEMRKEFG